MAKKRKTLGTKEIEAIADIITTQDCCIHTTDKEMDPGGLIPFTNTVACRNIRENLLRYLESVLDEDVIPFDAFEGLTDKGKEIFRAKRGIG